MCVLFMFYVFVHTYEYMSLVGPTRRGCPAASTAFHQLKLNNFYSFFHLTLRRPRMDGLFLALYPPATPMIFVAMPRTTVECGGHWHIKHNWIIWTTFRFVSGRIDWLGKWKCGSMDRGCCGLRWYQRMRLCAPRYECVCVCHWEPGWVLHVSSQHSRD